jgi:alpha-beta hydrolase superfamily lysophospholipase
MVLIGVAILAILLVLLFVYGPRETIDYQVAFSPVDIPPDIDGYLSNKEAPFGDIIDDAQKQVIWAGEAGRKTNYSVVYLHGFSATSHEIRPVPEKVAKALGANLYYTRFAGHGRTGDAMMEATPEKWLQDAIEAIEIGSRLGKKVIVLATSNGGGIGSLLLTNPDYADKVSGMILTSPAYKLAHPMTALLDFPWVRFWGTLVAGKRRGFEAVNADHEKFWTSEYPTEAVYPMATIQRAVRKADFSQIKVPALFFVSDKDSVVSSGFIRKVASEWGGESRLEVRELTDTDDPYHHVLSGDILSPNQTTETVRIISEWVMGLK